MGFQCDIQHHLRDIFGDFSRANMFGQTIGIFGIKIVKAALWLQFCNAKSFVAQHCNGQFTAFNKRFGQQCFKFLPRPFGIARYRTAIIAIGFHNCDADRTTFVDGFQHIWPRQWIAGIQAFAVHNHALGHGNTGRHQPLLCQFLVDGNHRRDHIAMGVFDAHQVEHSLNAAIFAGNAMQCVKHKIGAQGRQNLGDVAVHIDATDLVSYFFKCIGHTVSAHQGNRPFVRPTAHQDNNVNLPVHFTTPTR